MISTMMSFRIASRSTMFDCFVWLLSLIALLATPSGTRVVHKAIPLLLVGAAEPNRSLRVRNLVTPAETGVQEVRKMESVSECGWDDGVGDFVADITEDDWKSRLRRDDGGGFGPFPLAEAVALPRVEAVFQHILSVGVEHDYADVLVAEKVEDVLMLYGLSLNLSEQEREVVRSGLLWLGGEVQSRELGRCAFGSGEACC